MLNKSYANNTETVFHETESYIIHCLATLAYKYIYKKQLAIPTKPDSVPYF